MNFAAPVTVLFYSGHRRATFPRALVIDGKEVLVEGILTHEVTEDYASRERRHRFVVSVQGGLWEIIRFQDERTTCRRMTPAHRTRED